MEVSENPEPKITATSAQSSGEILPFISKAHDRAPEIGGARTSVPRLNKRFRTARGEVKSFLSKTIKSCVKWAVTRAVDIVAPGVGAIISACEKVIEVVKGIKAVATGKGEIGVPLATFGGFDFMIDVHVGDDPKGRYLPVSAFITPSSGDSVISHIDITPESDQHRAAIIYADLSRVPELPEPATRAGLIRSYTEQQVLPQLSKQYEGEFELVYVYDPETGIGAWMRVAGAKTQWCILVWRSKAAHATPN